MAIKSTLCLHGGKRLTAYPKQESEVLLRTQITPEMISMRREMPHTTPSTAYRDSGTPVSGVADGDMTDSEIGRRDNKHDQSSEKKNLDVQNKIFWGLFYLNFITIANGILPHSSYGS